MIHAFTVDVEDYDNVTLRDLLGLDHNLPPTDAVVRNTHRVLELLHARGARATFFMLGEVAESFPGLVREIASADHELGVHGYYHNLLTQLTPDAFRCEVREAKRLIEDIAQRRVLGHRAPAFTISPATAWALAILAEEGYAYDSSIFPFQGRRYGWPGFPPDIAALPLETGGSLVEAPMTTVALLGKRLPACGGGYLRLFPLWWTRWALRRTASHRPAIVYLHPYEVDVDAGPLDLANADPSATRQARRFHRLQLCNRRSVLPKLARLLSEHRFAPLEEIIRNRLGPDALAAAN